MFSYAQAWPPEPLNLGKAQGVCRASGRRVSLVRHRLRAVLYTSPHLCSLFFLLRGEPFLLSGIHGQFPSISFAAFTKLYVEIESLLEHE